MGSPDPTLEPPPSWRPGTATHLPKVWRPLRARIAAYTVALATVVVLAAVAVALPGGAGGARAADRVALVCVGLLIAAGLSVLAAPYVRADGPGVTVRNLTRRRQLEWAEIVSLRLRRGDPWLMIDLTDGTTLAAMGIQSADGARGRGAAAELASVVRGHQPWLREPSSGPHPR